MFDRFRIPRDNLLSNICDVSIDGKFVSKIEDKKKRLGASFGSLSSGRVNICCMSTKSGVKMLQIFFKQFFSHSNSQCVPGEGYHNCDQAFSKPQAIWSC